MSIFDDFSIKTFIRKKRVIENRIKIEFNFSTQRKQTQTDANNTMTDIEEDFCCGDRFYSATLLRDEAPLRVKLSKSANFMLALNFVSQAQFKHALSQFEPHIAKLILESERESLNLRATICVQRWTHAICYACQRAGRAVRPCNKCFLNFYCSDACQEHKRHDAFCCAIDAELDSRDPLNFVLCDSNSNSFSQKPKETHSSAHSDDSRDSRDSLKKRMQNIRTAMKLDRTNT